MLTPVIVIQLTDTSYPNYGLGKVTEYTYVEISDYKDFMQSQDFIPSLEALFGEVEIMNVSDDSITFQLIDEQYPTTLSYFTALKVGNKFYKLEQLPKEEYESQGFKV